MTHHKAASHIPHSVGMDEATNLFNRETALDEALWRALKVWGPDLPWEKRELIFEAAKALIIGSVRHYTELVEKEKKDEQVPGE